MPQSSEQPWLDYRPWQLPIRSGAKKLVGVSWLFAVIWCAVSSSIVFVLPRELENGNHAVLIGLLFPLVGLGLLWWAIRTTREYLTFGVTELNLDPYPGAIGGHVGGTISLPAKAGVQACYEAKLCCLFSYLSGSGKNRRRTERVIWESRGPLMATMVDDRVELSFRFDVPPDLPESEKSAKRYHHWTLSVTSDHQPICYKRVFKVPVFATAHASQHIQVDTSEAARQAARSQVNQALLGGDESLRQRLGLSLELRSGWIRLLFHAGRNLGSALVLLVVGLGFLGAGWFAEAGFLFRVLFGFVGFAAVVAALYLPFNSLDVRVTEDQAIRVRRWLGITIKRQQVDPRHIQSLKIEESSTSSRGGEHTVYYRLVGRGAFGRFRIAEGIDDKALIEALMQKVRQFANITPETAT